MNTNCQGEFRLIACPHPLSIERGRIDRMVPEGATVAQHIRALGWTTEDLGALVFIDEQLVPFAQWEYAVPRAQQNLSIRVIPLGGGGGGGEQGKTAIRIVAMLAVVVASVFTAGGALSALPGLGALTAGSVPAGLAAAGLSMVGSLRANTMIPARRQ